MTQENNNQNTNVKPQPMPATQTEVKPTPLPATPGKVEATPVNSQTANGPIIAQAPEFKKEEVKKAPVVNPTPATKTEAPKQEAVTPTQNVVNTNKKSGGNIFLFIVIIIIGAFVYKIDDVLNYFNQRHSPTPETTIKENTSDDLEGGYLVVGSSTGYIKLKSIKFSNFRKSDSSYVYFDYLSDRNYGIQNNLNLEIQLFDSNKTMIYSEDFNVNGSIESLLTRQYKILLEQEKYDKVYYALVVEKNINVGS